MGDFKCNSGISSDSKNQDQVKNDNNYNDLKGTGAAAGTAAASGIADSASQYTKSEPESYYKNDNSTDPTSQYTKSKSSSNDYNAQDDLNSGSDCGCGASNDDIESSGYNNDLQYQDDDQTATIYTETIIFADPYSGVDNEPATSDLVEDEQEGSEFVSSNPNRPQC